MLNGIKSWLHLLARTKRWWKVIQFKFRFYPSKVYAIIKSVFEERLAKEVFDPNTSPNIVEELTKIIRLRVKTGKLDIK